VETLNRVFGFLILAIAAELVLHGIAAAAPLHH
jgi:small neutral amino acid transporter SnatA (MarC family)